MPKKPAKKSKKKSPYMLGGMKKSKSGSMPKQTKGKSNIC